MLLCGGFHADLRYVHFQRGGDVFSHGISVGGHLGRLRDQCGVDVHHRIALLPQVIPNALQQQHTGDIQVRRVIIRKQLADISGGDRPQQRVHNGVGQHISIGMAVQSPLPRNGNAAQYQRPSFGQSVHVISVSDPQRCHRAASL